MSASSNDSSNLKDEGNVVHEKEPTPSPFLKGEETLDDSEKDSKDEVNKQEINPLPVKNVRYTASDLVSTPPPDFKLKVQLWFHNRGLASRPDYLQAIYSNMPRLIYYNQELPENMKYHNSNVPIVTYARNKIRTTKYTPLSFLPKNILFQFKNVANTYFLIMIILGAFQIFGVQSPGLAAVPLIVIVCITAIKDAFEDYNRGTSDDELNNSPIHLLQGIENHNVMTGNVGPWRKFKKKCSAMNRTIARGIKKGCIMVFANKKKKQDFIRDEHNAQDLALRRVSTVMSDYSMDPDLIEGRPSTTSKSRRSRHIPRTRYPSEPSPNSLLNPSTRKEIIDSNQTNSAFKNRCWKDISVGDMIRVRQNEEVPADIIVISTSDPEGNCYIETKNLDGETNLKNKNCLHCGGNDNLKHSSDLGAAKFWVECDPPNSHLYTFKGTVHYENYDANGQLINADEKEAVTNDNVLLRGSTLRNTKWVIGIAVYTGGETKIMLNSGITPTKLSRISRELNLSVVINFMLLFILCFVSGLINGLFYNKKHVSRLYFDFQPYVDSAAANGVLLFFVALIIYQSLVPISLYISVEIIKTLQAFFIFSDIKMYYAPLNFPCIPKSWNISDDLGQIEYIFSDKTGTLTQNVMEFKKCTIDGKSYGLAYTEAKQGIDKRAGLDVILESEKWNLKMARDKELMMEYLQKHFNNDQLREESMTFISSEYAHDTFIDSDDKQKIANERFMMALALCHTVVTEADKEDPSLKDFKAESPDEAALVAVARDVGITFDERLRKSVIVNVYGEPREYELLEIIAFTSARKRMSCIFRTPDGSVKLISKGADTAIFLRLASTGDDGLINKTALHLEDYAKEGLRTLCIAEKDLDPKYFDDWRARYKEALASIDDDRDDYINALDEELEQGLTLLGGTAIEDRLQQGVPDSIAILSKAGIKLWVLTGDRIETAINIGFSCNLLGNDMKLLVVRPDEQDPSNPLYIDHLITTYLQENFNISTSSREEIDQLVEAATKDHSTPTSNHALIIDGAALTLVFQDTEDPLIQDIRRKFLLLGKQCKSVICCRVSPSQKAQVVKVVKENLKVMTLAIGDGANDVAMIQSANVGVGIAGEEGRQAVMSSDYAIGQFRFLTRLLLVHGRWSYKRLAEMIPCFFYKNVVFTLTCFWFGIYSDFDGAYLYEYTYLMFYNLAFTSLPVIVLAVLDQDVSDTISLVVPQLYRSGILGKDWSQYKFAWYMFDGLYQSVIAFFFPYLLFRKSFQNEQGLQIDHRFWIGVVAAIVSVTSCDLYVLLQQYRWDWLSLLIDALSILVVFFWTGIWSSRVYAGEFYKAGAQILGTLSCWCCIFIGVLISILPRFTADFLRKNFAPRDIDIIRERARHGEYIDYPEGYDPTDLEDIERHKILMQINNGDNELLEKIEQAVGMDKSDVASLILGDKDGNIKSKLRSIKRRATILRSRKNTLRSRNGSLSESERHKQNQQLLSRPLNLQELRLQMIKDGEYQTSRNSLERIDTTHAVPGLTQAETLISYHNRNSMQLEN